MRNTNMIITKGKFIATIFFLTVFLSLNGQESRFKDFAENHKDRAFCFYPSTLRMLNIGGNPDFNNMVSGIEKLLVYKLDSISGADKLYNPMLDEYRKDGFEEYIAVKGGGNDMFLLGDERGKMNEFVGVVINEEISITFFLRGNIGWDEIPKIMNSIQDGEFIDILDLKLAQGE